MGTRVELANLIFPDIDSTIEDLEEKYPPRTLKEGAKVTRFAPSPTGFLHIGSLFTSLVAKKVASDTNGVFFVRLEDTDSKREVEGSKDTIISQLHEFGLDPDEGYIDGVNDKGIYGPYKQSERRDIYCTVIKYMIINDLAYPCFASEEELNELREKQRENKEIPGYYGKYAIYRDLDIDRAIEFIKEGKPYVIRFKSKGNHLNKIKVHDEVKGDLELSENDQDVVILKSDGLPTYHFAHVVDDHFMRTNLVTRGEEWLASLPLHLDMFKALGWKAPKYAHLPVIMKLDNGVRRKLSKRKDPEASVEYFLKEGYEPKSLLIYLMTIANSNYEEFLLQTKNYDISAFKFSFKNMSSDGALFDIDKLNYFGKEVLSRMNKDEISLKATEYASKYDPNLYAFINESPERFKEILNIERERKNPRKDYAKYSDIYNVIKFFDFDKFKEIINFCLDFNPNIEKNTIKNFLLEYIKSYKTREVENEWFADVKDVAGKYNFATDNKLYKANPSNYIGSINDACELIRIAITGSKVSPNLFLVMSIIEKYNPPHELEDRVNYVVSKLK